MTDIVAGPAGGAGRARAGKQAGVLAARPAVLPHLPGQAGARHSFSSSTSPPSTLRSPIIAKTELQELTNVTFCHGVRRRV